MTIQHDPTETFEDRLAGELRAYVEQQPSSAPAAPAASAAARRRRRPAMALGGATLAVVAGVLATQGGSPAYAVEAHGDGTVTIEINDLTDAAGLQRDLADAGVTAVVDYLAPGKVCAAGRFEPVMVRTPLAQQFRADGTGSLTIRPADIPSGTTFVLTSAVGKNTAISTIGFAKGAVKACTPVAVDAPELPPLPGGQRGGPKQQVFVGKGEAPAGAVQGGEAGVTVQGTARKPGTTPEAGNETAGR